jgi:hypothetical protein
MALASALSCGKNHGPDAYATDAGDDAEPSPIPGLMALTVSPSTANLVIGGTPSTQTFVATGTFADGSTQDVTAQVTWIASPTTLLVASGPTAMASGTMGGHATMTAESGALLAAADVQVTLSQKVFEPGAAAGSDMSFGGASDPSLSPIIAYPFDGTLLPPNLAPLEFQWQPAAGTTLFDVHVSSPLLDLHMYTPCNAIGTTDGCGLVPDAATWATLTTTLSGDDPAAVTVVATGSSGGVGTSAAHSLQLASTNLQGGLYYFNTQSASMPDGGTAQAGIFRYDFGMAKGGTFFTAGQCAGCHALTHDGKQMLATICTQERNCGYPLQLGLIDVASAQYSIVQYPVGDSTLEDWTPDGTYYLTTPACASINAAPPGLCKSSSGGGMDLVQASTGTAIGPVPAGAGAVQPGFSPDAKAIVYARGAPYNSPLSIYSASLYTLPFVETPSPAWGTESVLVQSVGENNYYPTFSPDGAWVLFARSQCQSGDPPEACDSYDDPSARVMAVPSSGGAPIDLAAANATGKLDNSWPRWAPFQGSYKAGNVWWLTFSTMRDYGFRVIGLPNGDHVRQLWIVGFDPAKAMAGKDPSFAPVWLSFQDPSSSNHTGQWTSTVVTTN